MSSHHGFIDIGSVITLGFILGSLVFVTTRVVQENPINLPGQAACGTGEFWCGNPVNRCFKFSEERRTCNTIISEYNQQNNPAPQPTAAPQQPQQPQQPAAQPPQQSGICAAGSAGGCEDIAYGGVSREGNGSLCCYVNDRSRNLCGRNFCNQGGLTQPTPVPTALPTPFSIQGRPCTGAGASRCENSTTFTCIDGNWIARGPCATPIPQRTATPRPAAETENDFRINVPNSPTQRNTNPSTTIVPTNTPTPRPTVNLAPFAATATQIARRTPTITPSPTITRIPTPRPTATPLPITRIPVPNTPRPTTPDPSRTLTLQPTQPRIGPTVIPVPSFRPSPAPPTPTTQIINRGTTPIQNPNPRLIEYFLNFINSLTQRRNTSPTATPTLTPPIPTVIPPTNTPSPTTSIPQAVVPFVPTPSINIPAVPVQNSQLLIGNLCRVEGSLNLSGLFANRSCSECISETWRWDNLGSARCTSNTNIPTQTVTPSVDTPFPTTSFPQTAPPFVNTEIPNTPIPTNTPLPTRSVVLTEDQQCMGAVPCLCILNLLPERGPIRPFYITSPQLCVYENFPSPTP